MLRNIDPLINPDLLYALARMGHGDEIVITDANFPSAAIAAQSVTGRELHIGCDVVRALGAVLSLFPLDEHQPDPVVTMQVVGAPEECPATVADALPLLAAAGVEPTTIERFAFYERAKTAFAVLRTADARPYGNFILRKGVINPIR
ncbi:MAG: RbsD/FucU domain-containing protein [Paracoccaceae bacterium]